MRYVVFDTETSGLFDFKRAPGASGQPRLASAAFVFLTPDLYIEKEYHVFVRPDDWIMPAKATAVNGITNEMLQTHGVPIGNVLRAWNNLIDQGVIFIAHNDKFDLMVMQGELQRAGLPDRADEIESYCTMRGSTNVCCIPGARGYKWPKLIEAYQYFFNTEFENAHEALADARACASIFRRLNELGHYKAAA